MRVAECGSSLVWKNTQAGGVILARRRAAETTPARLRLGGSALSRNTARREDEIIEYLRRRFGLYYL